jgi:uncharacterized hydrophobic protein (TIGR00271 family)
MDGWRNKINHIIGIEEGGLQETAESLYHLTEKNPIVYWIYLFVSAGIAYFGLIMNSAAVVIGAMLVSPLMTPLVQTGMAFAVGNFYLAVKSLIRVFMSVLLVTIIAAITTLILPFQEITTEILARTEPTALDLFVALLCALVASLASARKSGDTMTAAAGTAISIALVPPVCVMGFGLGILDGKIFIGSTLLFVANFAAIILVSDFFFIMTGFSNVDEILLEENVIGEMDRKSHLYRMAKSFKLDERSKKKWSKLRIYLPIAFVALIALPLSVALSQVAWEVNTKKNINKVLFEFEKKYKIVNRQQKLADKKAAIGITIVGDPRAKDRITSELDSTFKTVLGVEPDLNIDIIPSTEYVGERFKAESDFLNTKFVPFVNQAPPVQSAGFPMQTQSASFTLSKKKIKDTVEDAVNLLNDKPGGPDCFAWSYNMGSSGREEIVLWRISDEALSENEKALIASYLKRMTDSAVTVIENRYPKALFVSSKPVSGKQIELASGKYLNGVSKDGNVMIDVYLRDPKTASSAKLRNAYALMNTRMLKLIENRTAKERLIIHNNSMKWKIELSIAG